MAKTNFYLKDPNSKSDTLVYLFFSYDGNRLKYSTGETINPKFWNEDSQRAKKSLTGSMEINNLFDRMEEEIKKIYREAITHNKKLNNEYLKEKLDSQINPSTKHIESFFDYLTEFIEVQKPTKSYRTIQKYSTLLTQLKQFQAKKHYTLTFDKIDSKFYDHITAYFINDLKLLNNSTAKYIKTLKTFLHWATERGYNTNNSFEKFKAQEKDGDIIYLTEDELFKLYNLDLSENQKLENVRDCFCFGCFTGLRYSDICDVKKDYIKDEEIHLVSEKTTERMIIPLNEYAMTILKRNNYTLPVISNQKTNQFLKELCQYAEFYDPIELTSFRGANEIQTTKLKYECISSHTARRTFVTLSLEKGMRAETVMKITGHKNYATFKKYINITSKIKLIEMKNIWNNSNATLLKVV